MAEQRDDDARSVLDGSAWREFCEALARAGDVVARDASPTDPLDRAEGYRYLSRLARLALEKFVEHADPLAPSFYRLSHETAKIGCDNPDSFYQNAEIDGGLEYRLSGTRGSVAYLGFGTYYGAYGRPGRSGCSGYLEADQLEIDADGRFEIALASEPRPGNWLPMEPDTCMLIVRQNVLDAEHEVLADLRIERVGADGPPRPLDPARLGRALRDAAGFVGGTAALFADWAEGFAREPNRLLPMDPATTGGAHGDPNIFFHMGYWRLRPDQALVVELEPPRCEYWNFQLNNHWMESLDYRHHRVHLNGHTARADADGRVRLVVAHRDPGVANWIDTAGHERGTMGLRWVKADAHPTPRCHVRPLADVAPDAP
ncbi:MAG: DUF1214 domain-containing protein [Myxococcota bacterium]